MEIKKRDTEIKEALAFANFLKVSTEKVIPHMKEKEYDYIIGKNTVEISDIVDQDEIEMFNGWYKTEYFLKNALRFQEVRLNLQDDYFITMPMVVRIRSTITADEYSNKIINNLLNGVLRFKYKGDEFRISKQNLGNQKNGAFHLIGTGGGKINPEGVIFESLNKKIKTANKQLSFAPQNSKRILLLSNRYDFTDQKVLLRVYAYLEPILHNYSNIDEIWIQFLRKEKNEHLLYWAKNTQLHEEKSICNLLSLVKVSFQITNFDLQKRILQMIENIIKKGALLKTFPNNEDRIEILMFLGKQAETIGYKKLYSLLKTFFDDPDPTPIGKEPLNCEFHTKIKNNEEYNIIWTVQGELSSIFPFVITSAINARDVGMIKKCLKDVLYIIKNTKNYYILTLWLSPLSELVSATHKLEYPKWLVTPLRTLYLGENGLVEKAHTNDVIKRVLLHTIGNNLNFLTEQELLNLFYLYTTEEDGYIPFLRIYLYGEKWFKDKVNLPLEIREMNPFILKDTLEGIITGKTKIGENTREDFYLGLWRQLEVTPKNAKLLNLIKLLVTIKPQNSKQAIAYISEVLDTKNSKHKRILALIKK